MSGLMLKKLTRSAGRIVVWDNGKVFEEGKELNAVDLDGHLQVKISWVDGEKYYPVARIMLIAFGDFTGFPESLWNEIEPLYKDNDKTNLSRENLFYRFNSGMVSAELEDDDGNPMVGFFHVPLFPGYCINEVGDMWSVRSRLFISWFVTKPNEVKNQKGGYKTTKLKFYDNGYKGTYLHRCLCLTFRGYGWNALSLVVNHKDGDKTNNDLDNLELISYRENNEHAIENGLAPGPKVKMEVKYLDGRPGKIYDTVTEAILDNGGKHMTYLGGKLIREDRVWPKYPFAFRYLDGPDWPTADWEESLNHHRNSKRARATNTVSGDVVEFSSMGIGAKLTGVNKWTVNHHLRNSLNKPTSGWLFEYV